METQKYEDISYVYKMNSDGLLPQTVVLTFFRISLRIGVIFLSTDLHLVVAKNLTLICPGKKVSNWAIGLLRMEGLFIGVKSSKEIEFLVRI